MMVNAEPNWQLNQLRPGMCLTTSSTHFSEHMQVLQVLDQRDFFAVRFDTFIYIMGRS